MARSGVSPVRAMPSVMKTYVQVSPRAIREVDRSDRNPEKWMALIAGNGKTRQVAAS